MTDLQKIEQLSTLLKACREIGARYYDGVLQMPCGLRYNLHFTENGLVLEQGHDLRYLQDKNLKIEILEFHLSTLKNLATVSANFS